MTIEELKKEEGKEIEYLYRGKLRPFLLVAVQDKEPCKCVSNCDHRIDGRFKADQGYFRIEYNYPSKTVREWTGFWTNKIENIKAVCN